MKALKRYQKRERSAVARRWGKLGNDAQQRMRIERGSDAETMRKRALDDARGDILRQGITYTARCDYSWHICRSVNGRTDQFDVFEKGRTVYTGGKRGIRVKYWVRL